MLSSVSVPRILQDLRPVRNPYVAHIFLESTTKLKDYNGKKLSHSGILHRALLERPSLHGQCAVQSSYCDSTVKQESPKSLKCFIDMFEG